jgi:predicted RNA-binding Zn-ribbon protein involved in translation (DUF1610 family)
MPLLSADLPKKSSADSGQKFGCDKCGYPATVYPPDSQYHYLLSEPCEKGDSKKMDFTCANCGKVNVRYWDRFHTYGAVA